jgi:hypothetical protein
LRAAAHRIEKRQELNMAAVIHLEAGVEPPKDPSSLVVARDVTGGFYAIGPEERYIRPATPPEHPVSEADRAAAIERASAHADQHGLNTVYVVS